MGIRFLCEACEKKLNIKEELAGKKGRCPKCDAKILIPLKSTLASGSGKAETPGETPGETVEPSPKEMLSASAKDSHVPAVQSSEDKNAAVPTEIGPPEVVQPPSISQQETSSGQSVFEEHPTAQWFVRPVSGGQFGPADGEVMQGWLKEERIGPDSLVWREGWEDWRVAEEVLEISVEVSANPPKTPVVDTPVTAKTPDSGSRMIHHQRARKRAKTMGVALIIGLAIVSIVLAVVLVMVARGNFTNKSENEESENETVRLELFPVGDPYQHRS